MRTSFRMRLCRWLLITAPLAMRAMDDAAPTTPITIYANFTGSYSTEVRTTLEQQLAAIMAPAGFQFAWRDLKSVGLGEVVGELVVASFKGDCAIGPAPPSRLDDRTLGWTHVSEGAILPFIDISCDRVRILIHSLSTAMSRRRQEEVLGGALARVMAHELYHVLAGTDRHSSRGVAKSYFTPDDLVSPDFNFEAKDCASMWRSRGRSATATRTPTAVVAAQSKKTTSDGRQRARR